MTVFVMDRVEPSIRGELTRWFLELKPGVFVGSVNTRIRELLWERICRGKVESGAVMVYNASNEQGFAMEFSGHPKRKIIDLEGIQLILVTDENEQLV